MDTVTGKAFQSIWSNENSFRNDITQVSVNGIEVRFDKGQVDSQLYENDTLVSVISHNAQKMKKISFRRYIRAFEAFSRYTEEYGYQLEHLLRAGDQHLKKGFSVLDIGAGTGFFAEEFLKETKRRASSYTAIDPSPEHVEQIKKNFRELPLEIDVKNDIFTAKTRLGQTFDLIIMSHSAYWFVPDPEPYILNARKYLKKGGVMVMYLQTPYTASHLLNLLLDNALPKNRVPNHKINSWTLMDILDDNNIFYENADLPGTLKADTLFEKRNEWLLKELVSFFLSVELEALDSKVYRHAKEALKKLSYKRGNDVKLNLEVGAITAF